ncbi:MAG: glycine--tRNA ligase subunit beta [Candidatus Margulisbacteria bacterium]|nr:glycine--tRNA ligase subunit beta [Candidatus Margulisiibacteriota bacterium]
MSTYLLEIGCEEIPARFMPGLLAELKTRAETALTEAYLTYESIETLGTYRRLALTIKGLGEEQPKRIETITGPPTKIGVDTNQNYLPPAIGFAKKMGVELTDLTCIDGYVTVTKNAGGQKTEALLPGLITSIIKSIPLPIAMQWGRRQESPFVRPVHWIVSLLDQEILPITLYDIQANRISQGHRFLSEGPIPIQHADHYEQALETVSVIVDPIKRKTRIQKNIPENHDAELLMEVTFLTEYPVVLKGNIDPVYLQLPQDVLIQCMKKHQKYFPLMDENSTLQPVFFVAAENVTESNKHIIIQGNERVLTARLEDTRFFWEEDLKHPLETNLPKLEKVVFQRDLGTLHDKRIRIQKLADHLYETLNFKNHETLNRALQLCKADLVSHMVYELPELQGIMGSIYAEKQGESPDVCTAIVEHYLPKFSGDSLPQTPAGITISIADKLDTIVACFYSGVIPTGSQDPLGIRRALYGILQISLHHKLALDLSIVIDQAYALLGEQKNRDKLNDFFLQRIRSLFIEKEISYDTVDAILDTPHRNIYALFKKATQLEVYRKDNADTMKRLIETAVRIQRLAQKATTQTVDTAQFVLPIEHAVYEAIQASNSLDSLAKCTPIWTQYFEDVLVMDKDPILQENRLAFLASTHSCYNEYLGNSEKLVVS